MGFNVKGSARFVVGMPRAKKTDGRKTVPKKAATKGHLLAKPLPVGTKLVDFKKCEWLLGKHIGQGGFGLIYAARRASDSDTEERHVVKIEPKANGPLFCEIHFYRNVKLDQVPDWKKKMNLKSLGIPTDVSSGNHEEGSTEYRFLVMERYSEDLQKLFERNGKRFPAATALAVALKVIDTLQFIHNMGYVHADIKAANLLLGLPPNENEVFLVDFGLAFRFSRDGNAMPYKEDPRRRHDGTLEFCSRDVHRGANPAPRGDFETLAFCVLQWLGGQLPWDPLLGPTDQAKERVFQKKEAGMNDVKALAASCDAAGMPDFVKFLEAVAALSYEEKIDYDRMRAFLQCALRRLGANAKSLKLTFDASHRNSASNSKTSARKRPQPKSPAARAKSPAARATSPAARAKSPAAKAKSPAARATSPAARAISPAARAKSSAARATPPAARAKSTAARAKSPAARAKSPLSKPPALNAKLAARTKSPAPESPGSRTASPGPSSQKRPKLTSPAPAARNAGSQTSPALLQALREQRRQRRQQQKS